MDPCNPIASVVDDVAAVRAQLWTARQEREMAIIERDAARWSLRQLEEAIDRLILARHHALCVKEGVPS